MPEASPVRAMFSRIAPRYDLLNHVLSAGVDRRWRRSLVRAAGSVAGARVVDVCTGTGDLANAFAAGGARVVGVDFARPMLERAVHKARGVHPGSGVLPVEGDALRLPLMSAAADHAAIAFGLRNLADRSRGLREMARVVKPGGGVWVLEFSMPPGRAVGALYRAYFARVLPLIGGWISGDSAAYRYLPETVLAWPGPAELRAEMARSGLVRCDHRLLSRGIACLSFGYVPDAAPPPPTAPDVHLPPPIG